MDLSDPRQRSVWRDHLAELFAGRKVVCGVAPLAAMTEWVTLLAESGSQKPLLVSTQRGAGPVPTEDEAGLVSVDVGSYPTMTEELRDHDRIVHHLPAHVRAAVDAYDPAREALWLAGPFVGSDPVEARPVVGGRPWAWVALEDKVVVDDLWDDVGYPRSASRVVAVDDPDALADASAAVDLGDGAVWVGDARDGFNGGGEFTRWVVTAEERAAAVDFFKTRCDRVRVMPFLEGVPCSVHGIVLPTGTAVFRPVELAVLRGEGRRFVYGGQATFWDPPPSDRDRMRDLVRRTGEWLDDRVDYLGGFGIDGILTADGFRPTELNPRFSGGLTTLARGLEVSLFQLLQLNLSVGRDPCVTARELEAWALPAMDAGRVAQPKAVVGHRVVEESLDLALSWDGQRLHRDEDGGLTLTLGPTAMGTFARLEVGEAMRVGDRVAPLNAALMAFLDADLGARLGPVSTPPDVRQ